MNVMDQFKFPYSIVKNTDGAVYARFPDEWELNRYLKAIGRIEISTYCCDGYNNGVKVNELIESLRCPQKLLGRPITKEDGA